MSSVFEELRNTIEKITQNIEAASKKQRGIVFTFERGVMKVLWEESEEDYNARMAQLEEKK